MGGGACGIGERIRLGNLRSNYFPDFPSSQHPLAPMADHEDEYINPEDAEEIIHEEDDEGGEEPMSDEDEDEGELGGTTLELEGDYGQQDFKLSADGTTMVFDPDGDFEGEQGSGQQPAGEDNSSMAAGELLLLLLFPFRPLIFHNSTQSCTRRILQCLMLPFTPPIPSHL